MCGTEIRCRCNVLRRAYAVCRTAIAGTAIAYPIVLRSAYAVCSTPYFSTVSSCYGVPMRCAEICAYAVCGTEIGYLALGNPFVVAVREKPPGSSIAYVSTGHHTGSSIASVSTGHHTVQSGSNPA
eukprot:1709251-Rhodomonas_salina.1